MSFRLYQTRPLPSISRAASLRLGPVHGLSRKGSSQWDHSESGMGWAPEGSGSGSICLAHHKPGLWRALTPQEPPPVPSLPECPPLPWGLGPGGAELWLCAGPPRRDCARPPRRELAGWAHVLLRGSLVPGVPSQGQWQEGVRAELSVSMSPGSPRLWGEAMEGRARKALSPQSGGLERDSQLVAGQRP